MAEPSQNLAIKGANTYEYFSGCGGKPAGGNQQNRMTSWLALYAARLRDFICLDSDMASSQFGTMALDLFARQFEHNAPYRQLCRIHRARPGTVDDWRQIPAVPACAFKELDLTCLPSEARTRYFCSSGTTAEKRSRHFHSAESLAIYEMSLLTWFKTSFLSNPAENPRCMFLTPSAGEAPTSSLVHMFETLRRTVAANGSLFAGRVDADGHWSLDIERLLATLRQCEEEHLPVTLLGTAFNFVHLIDALTDRRLEIRLPTGSRVMETGGYKGRSRSLSRAGLHDAISRSLGIADEDIISEYGMCELGSQAYDNVRSFSRQSPQTPRPFRFPPWARFLVVSPETGKLAGEGEPGLLRVFDLANAASVLAIQTEDLAIQQQDGFELIGRARQTEPRGCSLMSV